MPAHATPPAKRPILRMALATVIVAMATGYSVSVALEQQTVTNGLTACVNWCIRNNKSPSAVEVCQRRCQTYWYCNGSDASKWTGHCIDARRYRAPAQIQPKLPPTITSTPPAGAATRKTP